MSPDDKIRAGNEARWLLESPVLIAAFDTVRDQQIERWRGSNPDSAVDREDAYRMLRALDAVRDALRATLADGEFARAHGR